MAEYACAGAHIQYFRKEALTDVLEALGLELSAYNEACAKWTAVLMDESAADETEQAKLYGDSYTHTTAKLRSEKPLLADVAPLRHRPPAPVSEPEAVLARAAEPSPVNPPAIPDNGDPPVTVAIPSYLKASLTAAATPPPPAAVSGPRPKNAPLGPQTTTPAPVLTAPPEIVAPPLVLSPPVFAAGPSLAPRADANAADETLPPGSRPARSPALPFGDTPSPAFLAAVTPHAVAPRDDAGETMFLAAVPEAGSELPFAKRPETPPPPLTLEQYASLLVDIARAPVQRSATMARYGIVDEAMMGQLQLLWKTRGQLDPSLPQKLEAAKAGYERWLAERRR